jgi:hypothetical protein
MNKSTNLKDKNSEKKVQNNSYVIEENDGKGVYIVQ